MKKKRFAEMQIKLIHVKSSSFAPARSGVDDFFGVSDINNHQLSATDVIS